MNLLKVHECVRIENERLILLNRIQKIEQEDEVRNELRNKILILTAKISDYHSEIERKK